MIWICFFLGVLVGISISVLIVATLAYFKKTIERHIERVVHTLENKGPQPRGFIVEPLDEVSEEREKVIERNRKAGVDTKLSDLI